MVVDPDACTETSRHLLATSATLLLVTAALALGTLPTILRAYYRAREFERRFINGKNLEPEAIPAEDDGLPESQQPPAAPPAT